jgi:formylglycine-generating enzyme required for sulfatase activity
MKRAFAAAAAIVLLCVGNLAQAAITIETVRVGDPGNAADTAAHSGNPAGQGSVSYTYNIGKYEVTAGQYTAFLNAVAKTDTYGLYNTYMVRTDYGSGISRSGSSGSYAYSVDASFINRPVNYVSYWDSIRFANWLHNGRPTGAQGASTTERGAYTLDGYNGTDGRAIQRNTNWTWAVTSEDEWYKAAYYRGGGGGYWLYPTQSNSAPGRNLNDVSGNNANYSGNPFPIQSPYYTTVVGEFQNSDSAYGTFDQGGNVWEWNEAMPYISGSRAYRGLRGGAFDYLDSTLQSSTRNIGYNPSYELNDIGFRVSQAVPEPSSIMILAFGLASLLGIRRRTT